MKKLLFMLAACLFVLVSCEPEPILSLDKETLKFNENASEATVYITANNDWTVTGDNAFYKISPVAGTGSGYITVSVDPNTTMSSRKAVVTVTCSSRKESASKTLTIEQTCAVGDAVVDHYEISVTTGANSILHPEGSTITLYIKANAPWTLDADGTESLESVTTSGYDATVSATVGPCPVFEGRKIKFTLSCQTEAGGNTHTYEFDQEGGIIVYGDEIYHAAKMKDGKWWMIENLRYIPAGMTPSDDVSAVTNGIWYPLVINELTPDAASVKFSKEAADIRANGYLYNTETALGLKTGDLTVDNCKNYEGVQGICPPGWHIPTKADIVGLVGKTNDKNDLNPSAPYYDAELNGGNGSVALLNANGFNAGAWGAVSIANTTVAKASLMGAVKSYQGGMNTGYIAGSTLIDTGKNLTTNGDGSLKNCQFLGLMPFMGNGTYNGALNNYRNGVSVRCVKNN